MTDRELMQQALEALQTYGAHSANCEHLMLLTSLPPQRKPCSCGLVATIITMRERLAQPEQEPVAWRNAAIRVGEELSSVGPDGYYNMTAQQWLDWAMEQQPVGKTSLAQPDMPLFDDWRQFACPPCNHDCNQGRECPTK